MCVSGLADAKITDSLSITGADSEFISFQTSYPTPGGTLITHSTLRFSSREHVTGMITRSGVVVRHVFGDWSGGSFEPERSREVIFVAEVET
jgi:hypothetical protein